MSIKSIAQQIPSNAPNWYVVRTQLRCEKYLSEQFTRKGINHYLPIISHTRKWGRRIAEVKLPLFPNYIFVNINRKEYIQILDCEGHLGFVNFGGDLSVVREEEINLIQRILGSGEIIEVLPIEWNQGEEVEIVGGKLTGIKAKYLQHTGRNNVMIELQSIGFGLTVNIDLKYLQRDKRKALQSRVS